MKIVSAFFDSLKQNELLHQCNQQNIDVHRENGQKMITILHSYVAQ